MSSKIWQTLGDAYSYLGQRWAMGQSPVKKRKNLKKAQLGIRTLIRSSLLVCCSAAPTTTLSRSPPRRPKPTLFKTLPPAAAAGADGDGEAAMAAPATRRIVGTEVPIPSSDKLRWIDLTVPSSFAPASPADPFVCVPPRAASGCHIIPSGDSQYYLSWYVCRLSSLLRALLLFCSGWVAHCVGSTIRLDLA